LEAVRFPRFKAGNVLRGAFGSILRHTADPEEFARLFAPVAAEGPSGLRQPPRPLIFRCGHLNGARIPAGGQFQFDLHVFDRRRSGYIFDRFSAIFGLLEREGLGIHRGRAHLELAERAAAPVVIPLAPGLEPVTRLRLRFVTPTEWKGADHSFGQLLRRARDRVSTLRALYGEGPLDMDFTAFGAAADTVRATGSDLQYIGVERHSTRTGQVHPLGGFIGTVDYEGDLTAFLPLLTAATWTGVGRHTVWGQGQIEIRLQANQQAETPAKLE
jgi:hypothetical protein